MHIPMKSSKSAAHKKPKPMDYTNYAYNEAVSRLKLMLAESYAPPSRGGGAGSAAGGNGATGAYMRHVNEDSTDNYSDNLSVIERPVYSDISKYLSPAQKSRLSPGVRSKPKPFNAFSSSKENLTLQMPYAASTTTATAPLDYYAPNKTQPQPVTDSVHAPVEIFNFIEKQEDYIEQLEKESKYCRNELTNLLGKVKDVINENTHLTETARSELATLGGVDKTLPVTSPSSDSDEQQHYKKKTSTTPRSKKETSSAAVKSPRYASAPNIVYEARISELEAELMQANIDLKRLKTENEELKRKLAHVDPLVLAGAHTNAPASSSSTNNCDAHRKQIEHLQLEKNALEESVRQLRKLLDDAKSEQYTSNTSSKRYINDLVQMERAQAELEVKHLREELDRQHERVRELQHEMARRIADERATAERRYNTQVDQLGGDLSSQWEQVAKLQLDLEREKRYSNDMKRDLSNRNAQIDELKMELRSNRNTFLADMAQVNAEKQSLEQEITALRLQLDRAAREAKTEATRLTAEITSLRQRLDRGDADLLHSKREILRLNDEIANLEKELAYGEMKNEIRPTKKDLDKRISEMQEKHGETFVAKSTAATTTTTKTLATGLITNTKAQLATKSPTTTAKVSGETPTIAKIATPTTYAATTTTTTSGIAWSVPTAELTSTTPTRPTTTANVPATKTLLMTTTTTTWPTTRPNTTQQQHKPTAVMELVTGTKPKNVTSAHTCWDASGSAYASPPKWPSTVNQLHGRKAAEAESVPTTGFTALAQTHTHTRRYRYGSDENILANITKSNERLERELAKMPPLPTTMSFSAYRRQQRCAHLYRTPLAAYRPRSARDEGRRATAARTETHCGRCGAIGGIYGTHCSCSKHMKHVVASAHLEPTACTSCCCSANKATTCKQTLNTEERQFSFGSAHTLSRPESNFNVNTTNATNIDTTTPPATVNASARGRSLHRNCQNFAWNAHASATISTSGSGGCKAHSRLSDCKASAEAETSLTEQSSAKRAPSPTIHSLNTTQPHTQSTNYTRAPCSCAAGCGSVPKLCTACKPQASANICTTNTYQTPTCHPAYGHCKTEPLPWLQQHLVLKQTFSGLEHLTAATDVCHACQSPCQGAHLTVPTESKANTHVANEHTAGTSESVKRPAPTTKSKPRAYFEELLRREECCGVKRVSSNMLRDCISHGETLVQQKKPRPPVKVDVNVRLVPKAGKERKIDTDTGNTSAKTPLEVKVNLTQPAPATSERIKESAQSGRSEVLAPALDIPDLTLDDLELDDCDAAAHVEQ
ncbi:uncharacterized protein LOC105234093 isoform X2 [Bactrocera dorsalis]|uniref:Uncharacterized protein LOC105234093 isoform X2 n=1 Tax=Bactrocera dorsalis TaxID=27457 RepID=A0ABM3J5P8_BACDO|nr:uncharacterized protein LOC105234093 isoform X2 [Bactrocera dorsalis]